MLKPWDLQEHPSIAALRSYLSSKCPALAGILSSSPNAERHTGWIFSERLINMPVEVVPPMYRMLAEEMQTRQSEGEPFAFERLVFVSRTFTPTAEMEEEWAVEARASGKRAKEERNSRSGRRTMSYHFEDEVIAQVRTHFPNCALSLFIEPTQHATINVDYGFTRPREAQRTNESLGVETGGRIMVLEASKLPTVIEQMGIEFAPPGA